MENVMQEDLCKSTMRSELERDIADFSKIILVHGQRAEEGLGDALDGYEAVRKTDRKVLILSGGKKRWNCCKEGRGSIIWRCLTDREMQDILKLYYLYEFSDRVVLFSQESIFGGLLNYVDTGILTMDELVRALLD